jgi:ribosomal protein L7/L12
MNETEYECCTGCREIKPVACYLPGNNPLCLDCVVKGMKDHDDKIEAEKKRAVIEAKLSMVAEMERAVHRMQEDVIRELDALGLTVEDKVALLVKSGNKTRAIMTYREATGKSLTESKDFVDDLIDRTYR